jgi:hypothetical protein
MPMVVAMAAKKLAPNAVHKVFTMASSTKNLHGATDMNLFELVRINLSIQLEKESFLFLPFSSTSLFDDTEL